MARSGRIISSAETRSIRGALASATYAGDTDKVQDLKREFRVSKLADHIRAVVDEAPPLTKDQKARLVSLIRGGAR